MMDISGLAVMFIIGFSMKESRFLSRKTYKLYLMQVYSVKRYRVCA